MRSTLTVNGTPHTLEHDTRTSLLDLLRDSLGLTGTKKGCDHGQCGACTVLLNGRRINACLTLAAMHDGDEITTIEGLSPEDGGQVSAQDEEKPRHAPPQTPGREGASRRLNPLQRAMVERDGYQCGFCTSGQIMSATGMLSEAQRGDPSHVSDSLCGADVQGSAVAVPLSDEEIAERMSGNLCRCSAYPFIREAIAQSQRGQSQAAQSQAVQSQAAQSQTVQPAGVQAKASPSRELETEGAALQALVQEVKL